MRVSTPHGVGTCPACGGTGYAIRFDGTIRKHYGGPSTDRYVCPGSGQQPVSGSAETGHR